MARTKQEVRDFLNLLIGLQVNSKCGIYNGQCVSLIKALLAFLGAPNPYAARGNARDYGDNLVSQGIAKKGRGWLTVAVSKTMAPPYGHIWPDLLNECNFEQNGARALRVTKNTRPITQATDFYNLDQWIMPDKPKPSKVPKAPKYMKVSAVFQTTANLKVRKNQSTKYKEIGVIKKGKSIKVTKQSHGQRINNDPNWFEVNGRGWVSGAYLKWKSGN